MEGPGGKVRALTENFPRHKLTVEVWVAPRDVSHADGHAGWMEFTEHCHQAGVEYERFSVHEDGSVKKMDRWCPVGRERLPDGSTRIVGVKFLRSERLGLIYRDARYRDGDHYTYEVHASESSLPSLVDEPFEDNFVALARRLGSRAAVAQSMADKGIRHYLRGLPRRVALVDVPDTVFEMVIDANSFKPTIRFSEMRRRAGKLDRQYSYDVTVPASAFVVSDDESIEGMRALVASGHLAPGRRQRAMRDQMVQLLDGVGVSYTLRNNTREETLHSVYRQNTDCHYGLSLRMDPDVGGRGISVWEEYEYMPRPGDAGAEYYYGVRTPYESLATLVTFFEALAERAAEPDEDLEDRLAGAMMRLVLRGKLADGLELRANRERVAAWFAEAGVQAKPEDSVWINSD